MRRDTDRYGRTQADKGVDTRPRAAFTLMELLVVIAIMAIISTIAVGGYFGLMRAASYSAAHDNVYNTLSLTRQRAVIDGKATSFMVLNATNYVVVRAAGRISEPPPEQDVAYDVYTDLSGALYCDIVDDPNHDKKRCDKKIDVYNLDSDDADTRRSVVIHKTRLLQLRDVTNQLYTVATGYRFDGTFTRDFFKIGDRYGFALHARQSLPQGYLFEESPKEVRFNNDGSCRRGTTVTIEEKISKDNNITFKVETTGKIVDESKVTK